MTEEAKAYTYFYCLDGDEDKCVFTFIDPVKDNDLIDRNGGPESDFAKGFALGILRGEANSDTENALKNEVLSEKDIKYNGKSEVIFH